MLKYYDQHFIVVVYLTVNSDQIVSVWLMWLFYLEDTLIQKLPQKKSKILKAGEMLLKGIMWLGSEQSCSAVRKV